MFWWQLIGWIWINYEFVDKWLAEVWVILTAQNNDCLEEHAWSEKSVDILKNTWLLLELGEADDDHLHQTITPRDMRSPFWWGTKQRRAHSPEDEETMKQTDRCVTEVAGTCGKKVYYVMSQLFCALHCKEQSSVAEPWGTQIRCKIKVLLLGNYR